MRASSGSSAIVLVFGGGADDRARLANELRATLPFPAVTVACGPRQILGVLEATPREPSGVPALIAQLSAALSLSPREADILSGAARGRSVKEVAAELRISRKTVEFFWSRLYKKLSCRSQVEALAILLRAATDAPRICPGCAVRPDNHTVGPRRIGLNDTNPGGSHGHETEDW